MKFTVDIATYSKILSEQKLFQFLNALNKQYDTIKKKILGCDPLHSAEGAYAAVRKEMAHQGILGMITDDSYSQNAMAAGLIANRSQESEDLRFLSKGNLVKRNPNNGSSSCVDKSKLKCNHYETHQRPMLSTRR